jgi:flagellar operon protein (TIGR03826 family)
LSFEVANCPRCKALFRKVRQSVCPNCIKEIDQEYEKCYKYIRKKENRGCNIQELSEATGVSIQQITMFITEGRLNIDNNPNMSYACRSCGKPTRTGSLCESCIGNLKKIASYMKEDEQKRLDVEERKRREQGFYQMGRKE